VRASKEVLHKLQFFVELLHGGVCGAVPNTPIIVNNLYFFLKFMNNLTYIPLIFAIYINNLFFLENWHIVL